MYLWGGGDGIFRYRSRMSEVTIRRCGAWTFVIVHFANALSYRPLARSHHSHHLRGRNSDRYTGSSTQAAYQRFSLCVASSHPPHPPFGCGSIFLKINYSLTSTAIQLSPVYSQRFAKGLLSNNTLKLKIDQCNRKSGPILNP